METTENPPLPPGVEYLGDADAPPLVELADEKDQDGNHVKLIVAYYRVHGLRVKIGWMVGHPMGGFSQPNLVNIDFDSSDYGTSPDGDASKFSKVFDGVTSSVLRAVPIGHAMALMRATHERLSLQDVEDGITPLPTRVVSDWDYAHVAAAYVDLVRSHSVQPIQRLSEWTGESVDTWFARLRRARAKGILRGKGREASIAPAYWPLVDEIRASLRSNEA